MVLRANVEDWGVGGGAYEVGRPVDLIVECFGIFQEQQVLQEEVLLMTYWSERGRVWMGGGQRDS